MLSFKNQKSIYNFKITVYIQSLNHFLYFITSQLLNKQVAISETERDRILKEHEKNMMTIENR